MFVTIKLQDLQLIQLLLDAGVQVNLPEKQNNLTPLAFSLVNTFRKDKENFDAIHALLAKYGEKFTPDENDKIKTTRNSSDYEYIRSAEEFSIPQLTSDNGTVRQQTGKADIVQSSSVLYRMA